MGIYVSFSLNKLEKSSSKSIELTGLESQFGSR